jgi:ATP-dependent protease Clp ATPase subunit
LTLIEDKGEFSGISWIFAGAFSSLFAKTRSTYIGFPAQVEDKEKPKKIQDSDIIKTGILPELLGRISLVLQLDTFTKEDFKRVLVERLLPLYPTLESVDVDEMVENAYNSELGIRSLTRQLELLAIDQEWEATL